MGLNGISVCSRDVTGSCYIGVYLTEVNIERARAECAQRAVGGHLVEISDDDEFDIVGSLLSREMHCMCIHVRTYNYVIAQYYI